MPFTVSETSPITFEDSTPAVASIAILGLSEDYGRSIGAASAFPGIPTSMHPQMHNPKS